MISDSAKPFVNIAKRYFKSCCTKEELAKQIETFGDFDAVLENFIQQRILRPMTEGLNEGLRREEILQRTIDPLALEMKIQRKKLEDSIIQTKKAEDCRKRRMAIEER